MTDHKPEPRVPDRDQLSTPCKHCDRLISAVFDADYNIKHWRHNPGRGLYGRRPATRERTQP